MTPGARPRAAGSRGFTLIEILVVVMIISLAMGMVVVRLDRRLPLTRSESAAREFLSILDLARTSAVARGGTYEVEIELEADRYRILTPFDRDGRPARSREDRVPLRWYTLPDGVHFGGVIDSGRILQERGVYRLPFTQMGSAQELYVYLDNEAGEGYGLTVRVLALTGASKVMREHFSPPEVTESDF